MVIFNAKLWALVQTQQEHMAKQEGARAQHALMLTELKAQISKYQERESWLLQHVNRLERERGQLLEFILNQDSTNFQAAVPRIEKTSTPVRSGNPEDVLLSQDELFADLGDDRARELGIEDSEPV